MLFEFFINLRRNKNSWCSYLTHKGYSTNIVGWLNDFTLGSDTSYLPLLGPSFLSTNGNNHTYPVGSWCRLRWKAFSRKGLLWIQDTRMEEVANLGIQLCPSDTSSDKANFPRQCPTSLHSDLPWNACPPLQSGCLISAPTCRLSQLCALVTARLLPWNEFLGLARFDNPF